jgi:hypothetical protein
MVITMSDVSFNEPQYVQKSSVQSSKQSLLTRTTIGLKLAKDETGAQKTMMIGTVVISLLAVGIYFYSQTVLAGTGKYVAPYPAAPSSGNNS